MKSLHTLGPNNLDTIVSHGTIPSLLQRLPHTILVKCDRIFDKYLGCILKFKGIIILFSGVLLFLISSMCLAHDIEYKTKQLMTEEIEDKMSGNFVSGSTVYTLVANHFFNLNRDVISEKISLDCDNGNVGDNVNHSKIEDKNLLAQLRKTGVSGVVYVNLSDQSTSYILELKSVLQSGKLVIIDGTDLGGDELADKMATSIGIGFSEPVVVARMVPSTNDQGETIMVPRFHAIATPDATTLKISDNTTYFKQELNDILCKYTKSVLVESGIDDSSSLTIKPVNASQIETNHKRFSKSSEYLTSTPSVSFFPGEQFEIILRKSNISCVMDDGDGKNMDYCDGQATIDLRYSIALIRSVKTQFENGVNTKNAKYVRVSISEDVGTGAGIHLRDNLIQENVKENGLAHRKTRFGPLAHDYSLWVKPVSGFQPSIYSKKPDNANTNFHKVEKSIFNIGTGLELTFKPKPEAGGFVNFGVVHTRVLDWNTYEYRVRNLSSITDFQVSWDRALNNCDEITYREAGCFFTSALWGDYWVFAKDKFTPISHANFTPNIDVIYEAPPEQIGFTDFELGINVTPMVKFGSVRPMVLFSLYTPDGEDFSQFGVSSRFRIHWDNPVFETGVPVILKSMADDNICLGIPIKEEQKEIEQGTYIEGQLCTDGVEQAWSLDNRERYRARFIKGMCMAVASNKIVVIAPCNQGMSQKWYWKDNTLYSRYVDGSNEIFRLSLDVNGQVVVIPENSFYSASEGNHLLNGKSELTLRPEPINF